MDYVARFERGSRHAARIARLARSFQAVDQNQLACRIRGSLRADQQLNTRLGFKEHVTNGPTALALGARPKITGNGCQVGIFEERLEGAQPSLWLGYNALKKNF
jgi:hypothetical protein